MGNGSLVRYMGCVMSEQEVAVYGSWRTPITSELVASGTQIMEMMLDGDDVYWRELRPTERGRHVVMRAAKGRTEEVTPAPFDVRTLVHEYGGGSFVVADGVVYFSNLADQRLYRQVIGDEPRPITPTANLRYADGTIDRRRGRLICVREDHTVAGREAVNTLVSLNLEGGDGGEVLVSGNDFYSSPRLGPDGSYLAWLAWNHPNMPWDATELWVGELRADGSLGRTERVAGGRDESILQPEWSPDEVLHFISDRTGWWNLYRWRHGRVESLCDMAAEFGRPPWTFGMSSYAFESAERIVCVYNVRGTWQLAELDVTNRKLEPIENPYSDITYVRAAPGRSVFVAGSPTEPESIVQFNFATRQFEVLYRSRELAIDPGYLSTARAIEFPTSNDLTAHAFFYAPRNRDFTAPSKELPPLIVIAHGGPTSSTKSTLNLAVQYWTSRGLAVLDVNYGGSTGYGRSYRRRLYGQWGVVDVDDCANGAMYLVKRGEADGSRLAIRGGSAGGYTTLCALTFRNIFRAGASYYGISDLGIFDKETHKFESRYDLTLVGPYPERRDLYRERSPIHFIDRISSPAILFQGLEDKIVPPNQAELIVEALRTRGMPVAYLPFEGEQHGFRRTENIKRALDAELYFYSKVFRFRLADPVEPIKIDNF
jgi:dipeptidyl aminopeptidase/acylaminoacyl peptidase